MQFIKSLHSLLTDVSSKTLNRDVGFLSVMLVWLCLEPRARRSGGRSRGGQ